jgi:hypothetical protein
MARHRRVEPVKRIKPFQAELIGGHRQKPQRRNQENGLHRDGEIGQPHFGHGEISNTAWKG